MYTISVIFIHFSANHLFTKLNSWFVWIHLKGRQSQIVFSLITKYSGKNKKQSPNLIVLFHDANNYVPNMRAKLLGFIYPIKKKKLD